MQDCPLCNAGMGSNLTESGIVECDASIMDGDGTFGAVGAVPGRLPVLKKNRRYGCVDGTKNQSEAFD